MSARNLDPQPPWVLPEPVIAQLRGAEQFMALTRSLDVFCGRWHKLRELAPDRLHELRRVATIESVASSTRIEGAELSDDEVGRVLAGLSLDSFRIRDEQEVRGYHELLQLIFEQHTTLEVTENSIKEFHRILLQYSDKDRYHRGRYKSGRNDVEAHHPDGRREVILRTAPPAETQWWMPRLLDEFRTAQQSGTWHPLVLIADFILWFLAIHPFEDGNGRLSRALTSLLLLKHDYAYIPYASLERIVEDNKAAYYAALRQSQLSSRADSREYTEWLVFFLGCLRAQQERLTDFVEDATRRASLGPAQSRILDFITRHGPMTSPSIARDLALNERTVRYHMNLLTRKGILEATHPIAGRLYGLPGAAIGVTRLRSEAGSGGTVDTAPPRTVDVAGQTRPSPAHRAQALPNGRSYAAIVVTSVDCRLDRLGDSELDHFESFVARLCPHAVAVAATADVAWWQLSEGTALARFQAWLRPGPEVVLNWALGPQSIDNDSQVRAEIDAVVFARYLRDSLSSVADLLASLKVQRGALFLGAQTYPSGGASIVGVQVPHAAGLLRSGGEGGSPPWTLDLPGPLSLPFNVPGLVRDAVDTLLRHFSYRHTARTLALIESQLFAPGSAPWSVDDAGLVVTGGTSDATP